MLKFPINVFSCLRAVNLSAALLACVASVLAHGAQISAAKPSSNGDGIAEFVLDARAAPTNAIGATVPSEIVRSRAVTLDVLSLQKMRAGVETGQAQTMRIGFFDDAALVVEIARVERVSGGAIAYIGNVAGSALSSVVIVEEAGVVSGNVNIAGKKFQIRNFGDAGHLMREVDVAALPPDHGPSNVTLPRESAKSGEPATARKLASPPEVAISAADDGSMIDVMVMYTPAARISQGGTLPMKSLINLGIAETNTAYANSGVTQRVRLVFAGEVNYTEADFATDLARLGGTTDGFMDEVHQLRDLYGADVVSLWGNYPPASGCGLANLMLTELPAFANQAFHVVDRNCATSNYSFAHELGHNMGLQHDIFDGNSGTTVTPEGSSTPTAINYAHGYVDVANRFRSVMGISALCDAQNPRIDCLRIPYFSNPAVFVDNRPFFPAAAASATTGNANAQEFKALNDTRETTANFRMSVDLAGPGTIIFSPVSYTVNEAAASVTLSATRHAGSTGAVSIAYATTSGSALAGTDFTATSGTLAWATGEAGTKTITIPILRDGVLDGPKAFTVNLDTPTGGVSIGAPGGTTASATVNVIDSDTDSFPVGCTVPFTGWANPPASGSSGWSVAIDSFYGPPCSLKSNPIADGGRAQIQFSGDFTAGSIRFARRVSSQSNDCLRVLIDGTQPVGSSCDSGEVGWSIVNVPISAGTHTVTWSYEKDGGGSAGADAAWIDDVVLPLNGPPLILSAPPPGGFLNIPYSHTFVASGSAPISFSAPPSALPPGLTLSAAGVLSGTPTTIGPGPYTAFVTATNSFTSNERQFISIAIVGAAPGAPIIGGATPDNGQASIAFAPPLSQGSTAITGYTATCNPNAFTAAGNASPLNVTGLVNGTEYTCSVTATNIYGTGASSTSVLVTPLPTRPSAPGIGAATPGNTQAFIAFAPPVSDGGSPITGYTATCNPGALAGTAVLSPVTVSNLVNDTAYVCSVKASNAVGASVASATVPVTPSASVALEFVGALSRKTHGTAGTFDIAVDRTQPISGDVSVEPRAIISGHTVLLQFNTAVSSIGASSAVDSANAAVFVSAMASGNDVIVSIPTLADNKRVTISLTDVNAPMRNFSVSLGFLIGDVNNTRSVNSSDISAVKARSGQATTIGNFRFDVNASGAINSSDISAVKARSGLTLP